jgi:ribosome-associated heat shock protein Hsp15
VAAECLVDHSPPEPSRSEEPPVFARERGAGRPTKRDRRRLDRFRAR